MRSREQVMDSLDPILDSLDSGPERNQTMFALLVIVELLLDIRDAVARTRPRTVDRYR